MIYHHLIVHIENPVKCQIAPPKKSADRYVPYPGWRFRKDENGMLHHEKITIWDRVKELFALEN